MKVTVRAGVGLRPAEIYDLDRAASRALLLYDLAVRQGLEREQYDDGQGTYHVLVTADAEKVLPQLALLVAGGEGVAPYHCEWSTFRNRFEDDEDAERQADALWREHGPEGSGAIYELEED